MKEIVTERRDVIARRIRFTTQGSSLGITAANMGKLISQIERGFSFQSLRALESHSGISIATIASIIGIPERTLARRRTAGRLSPQESERLLRVSTIFEKAVELFEGDAAAAAKWLMTPRKALGGDSPLGYARTEPGAREVENLIGRLEHGVLS